MNILYICELFKIEINFYYILNMNILYIIMWRPLPNNVIMYHPQIIALPTLLCGGYSQIILLCIILKLLHY